MAVKRRVPSNRLTHDIDPKNNGNSFFHDEYCSSNTFCRVLAAYGASGQRCPRIKPMKTHSEERSERDRLVARRERERERKRLTAYSPLRTSPARKDKCSRLAIYLNSRLRRWNGDVDRLLLLFLPSFAPSLLPGLGGKFYEGWLSRNARWKRRRHKGTFLPRISDMRSLRVSFLKGSPIGISESKFGKFAVKGYRNVLIQG